MKYYEMVELTGSTPEWNILSEDEIVKGTFGDFICLTFLTRLGYIPTREQIITEWCILNRGRLLSDNYEAYDISRWVVGKMNTGLPVVSKDNDDLTAPYYVLAYEEDAKQLCMLLNDLEEKIKVLTRKQ